MATPLVTVALPQPEMSVELFWNSTLPPGEPVPGAVGVTAAVRVTGALIPAGLAQDVRAVVLSARLTVCEIAVAVDPWKLELPE